LAEQRRSMPNLPEPPWLSSQPWMTAETSAPLPGALRKASSDVPIRTE
jgi:hypothetical protein